jgi:hypothetical protein
MYSNSSSTNRHRGGVKARAAKIEREQSVSDQYNAECATVSIGERSVDLIVRRTFISQLSCELGIDREISLDPGLEHIKSKLFVDCQPLGPGFIRSGVTLPSRVIRKLQLSHSSYDEMCEANVKSIWRNDSSSAAIVSEPPPSSGTTISEASDISENLDLERLHYGPSTEDIRSKASLLSSYRKVADFSLWPFELRIKSYYITRLGKITEGGVTWMPSSNDSVRSDRYSIAHYHQNRQEVVGVLTQARYPLPVLSDLTSSLETPLLPPFSGWDYSAFWKVLVSVREVEETLTIRNGFRVDSVQSLQLMANHVGRFSTQEINPWFFKSGEGNTVMFSHVGYRAGACSAYM